MIVADVIAKALAACGVRYAYGMVGSTVAPVAESLVASTDIRVVPVRHEQAGAHMADATARLTRRPAVSYGHATPGGLNLVMGAATALQDNAPVIFLNGDVEREQFGREAWQSSDTMVEVMAPVTKGGWRLEDPQRAAEWTRRAVRLAVSGRPGPVYLQIPRDVMHTEYTGPDLIDEQVCTVPMTRSAADPAVVREMAQVLQKAKRPVVAAGGGVVWSGAERELLQVAKRLGAPVITSQTSRGVVDEAGPWCLGASGHLGNPVASQALSEADVVLAVGNRMSDLQWDYGSLWTGQTLLHVDADPTELGRYYPAHLAACADARLFLGQLLELLPAEAARPAALEALFTERDAWIGQQKEGDGTFGPADVMAAAWSVLPEDTIYTVGAGRHAQFSSRIAQRKLPGIVKAIGSAAMGHALPAALAASIVCPDRPVVGMVGDGDFLMNIQDLETAVREQMPAIFLVFNDFRLASQGGKGFSVGVRHGNPDFLLLAEAFGCFGARATSAAECRSALKAALEARRPAIVDARVQG